MKLNPGEEFVGEWVEIKEVIGIGSHPPYDGNLTIIKQGESIINERKNLPNL